MSTPKKIKLVLLSALFGGALCSANLAAQDNQWQDFEYLRRSIAWFGSENASGLQYLPIQKISLAEVFLNKSDGKFINYYQSDDRYEWGAQTESYFRLNPKVVFYGKVNYANSNEKNGSGSVFINPYYNPFDILTGEGDKNLEKYNLTGAVGIQLSSRWSLGGKLDYNAANYAKYKDLRHTNKLLDLSATLGFCYRLNKTVDLGLNYYYRKSVEGLTFKTYGTTDKQYVSMINFGAFYGRNELFGELGYTGVPASGDNPVFNEFNGVSLQLNLNLSPQWQFFNEFSYKSRNGYYGKRSSTSPVYAEHKATVFAYTGTVSLQKQENLHLLKVGVENEQLENFENIYTKENNPGGSTNIIYYGETKVLDRKQLHANVEYTANLGVKAYHPAWVLKAGADFHNRQQTTILYPFFRKQTIRIFDVWLAADRNIIKEKNRYGLSLALLYGSGGGTAKKDGTYATPSSSQREPARSDDALFREYEYLTAGRIRTSFGFSYSRLLKPDLQGYVRLNYELTHALQVEYLNGKTFGSAVLSAGCVF